MEVVCVGNALKEVITADECRQALVAGVNADHSVLASVITSDGGDGFLDAYLSARPMDTMEIACTGPLGRNIYAKIGVEQHTHTAVIESASTIGIALVDLDRRNVMHSSSAGLADLIFAAAQKQCTEIIVGLGGSATCDGGIGLLWRLAEHIDLCQFGCPEIRTAMDMVDLPSPDITALSNYFSHIKLKVYVDVDNPLLGDRGAVYSFAGQKGANATEMEQLEFFMSGWAARVQLNGSGQWQNLEGAGAAGGLGFALAAVGAELIQGSKAMSDLIGLPALLKPGVILVTAEGKFDVTSLQGKATWYAATQARDNMAAPVIFAGIADADAVKVALNQGIVVVEFGPDIPVNERRERSAEQLSKAVSQYLDGVAEATV